MGLNINYSEKTSGIDSLKGYNTNKVSLIREELNNFKFKSTSPKDVALKPPANIFTQ